MIPDRWAPQPETPGPVATPDSGAEVRMGAWRVELARPGYGVHVVEDLSAAVRLADEAPSDAVVEWIDQADAAMVLDPAAVERMIAEEAW